MKEKRKDIGYIYSFDIETNQYYDYTSWTTAAELDSEDATIPGADRFFNTVSEVVSEYATKLNQSCLEGSKLAEDAYNEIVSRVLDRNPEATAMQRDMIKDSAVNFLDKYYPHTPTKVETYVATFVCIPWDMRKRAVDGSIHGKMWYDYTADEFKNELKNATTIVCTSEDEIDRTFREIYSEGKANPNIVLIHNLSYEFNNCIRRLPFFKKMIEENKIKFLSNNAVDSIKSMELYDTSFNKSTADGKKKKAPKPVIYFRDTWKLTCMSIDKLGKIHKFPKLPYEYGIIRDPKNLTAKDFEYNRRDCDIALLGFHDAWTQATEVLNTRYTEHGSIPVSANNIVSSMAKTNFAAEFEHHASRVQPEKRTESGKAVANSGASHLSFDIYKAFRKVTGGGLVFVNPFFAYTKFEVGKTYIATDENNDERFKVQEIRHIDLISAHPSQAFKRFFPTQAPVRIPETEFKNVKAALEQSRKEILEIGSIKGIRKGLDCFSTLTQRLNFKKKNSKDIATSGFAKFTFINLRPKNFYINRVSYSLPCLWHSKITTTLSGAAEYTSDEYSFAEGDEMRLCGSKVFDAKAVSINLKFEDFLAVVCLFYDFDSFEIDDVYLYAMGMISPYLYKQFASLGEKKNAYKAINKALGKSDIQAAQAAAQCKQVLEAHQERLDECSGSSAEVASLYEMSVSWLAAAKAQFNGVYGSSYQGLERDASILEIDENGEVVWTSKKATYDEENKSGIDYLQGAYIATWSRVDIALYTYLLASEKAIPLYIATDSVYYLVTQYTTKDLDEVLGLDLKAEEYEQRAFNKPVTELFKNRPNIPMIGGMDNENPITVIGYTQALKLICQERAINKATGEVELHDCITFSGTTAEKTVIDDDGNELEVGFFAGCNDIHSKIERLFQEFGIYTKYDMCTKNKKTAGSCDSDGAYELVGQNFINNDPADAKYQNRKIFANFLLIEEL